VYNWTKGGLDTLLSKLWETRGTDWRHGSGRPKCTRTEESLAAMEELTQPRRPAIPDIKRDESLPVLVHRDLSLKRCHVPTAMRSCQIYGHQTADPLNYTSGT